MSIILQEFLSDKILEVELLGQRVYCVYLPRKLMPVSPALMENENEKYCFRNRATKQVLPKVYLGSKTNTQTNAKLPSKYNTSTVLYFSLKSDSYKV